MTRNCVSIAWKRYTATSWTGTKAFYNQKSQNRRFASNSHPAREKCNPSTEKYRGRLGFFFNINYSICFLMSYVIKCILHWLQKHSNKHLERSKKSHIHQENIMNNPMTLSGVLHFLNFSSMICFSNVTDHPIKYAQYHLLSYL